MSEINKLYENAGVEKEVIPCPAKYYGYNCTRNNWDDADCSCDIEGYPPFTAEKQLEIVKFLLKKAVYYDVKDDKYWFYYEEYESAGYKPFDEAIAHFINKLWQDLTEEERKQIRNILVR